MASLRPPTISRGDWETDHSDSSEREPADELLKLFDNDDAYRRRVNLARTIEGEVIPRLVLAHMKSVVGSGTPESSLRDAGSVSLDESHVEELTRILLSESDDTAWDYVLSLQTRGVAEEELFLDLLTPTARRLGDLWVADICDFAEVTIGLGRLQLLLRKLSTGMRNRVGASQDLGRRVLLAATPGEQHTFGILMVAEFMRREGWDVTGEPGLTSSDLEDLVAREWYSVVGLSLHSERSIDALASCIHAIRRKSKNRAIGIMVGGQLFMDRPELTPMVGADATAEDAPGAARQADKLLGLLPMRC